MDHKSSRIQAGSLILYQNWAKKYPPFKDTAVLICLLMSQKQHTYPLQAMLLAAKLIVCTTQVEVSRSQCRTTTVSSKPVMAERLPYIGRKNASFRLATPFLLHSPCILCSAVLVVVVVVFLALLSHDLDITLLLRVRHLPSFLSSFLSLQLSF